MPRAGGPSITLSGTLGTGASALSLLHRPSARPHMMPNAANWSRRSLLRSASRSGGGGAAVGWRAEGAPPRPSSSMLSVWVFALASDAAVDVAACFRGSARGLRWALAVPPPGRTTRHGVGSCCRNRQSVLQRITKHAGRMPRPAPPARSSRPPQLRFGEHRSKGEEHSSQKGGTSVECQDQLKGPCRPAAYRHQCPLLHPVHLCTCHSLSVHCAAQQNKWVGGAARHVLERCCSGGLPLAPLLMYESCWHVHVVY